MKKCKFSERNKGDARKEKGRMFADEIDNGYVTDFEKSEKYTQTPDRMVHVSTFVYAKGNIYMTYYANTKEAELH